MSKGAVTMEAVDLSDGSDACCDVCVHSIVLLLVAE